MKELARTHLVAIQNGTWFVEFYNPFTKKSEIRPYKTLRGMNIATTKFHNKMCRMYSHLLQEE